MEGKYANIIIDISHEKVDRPFQYIIPEELIGKIEVGMEVCIPFGSGNKERKGYVIEITDKAEFEISKLKEIIQVVKDGVLVESDLIRLAYWMKENYGSTMISALKTVLPVKQKLKAMEQKKIILLCSEEEANNKLEFYKKKHQHARVRFLEALMDTKEQPYELIAGKLSVAKSTIQAFEEQGMIRIDSNNVYRNPISFVATGVEKKKLSDQQEHIVNDILQDEDKGMAQTYLIHGITGSGKTEVYMEIIAGMIEKGKQAIVLIPEIALTYQTVLRFYKRFGDRVSVMNSKLSKGERFDQFERAKRGEIDIIIGPRSALFTPFCNLGLIVIDEEHENSYKSEVMPKYHAREVARQMASYYGAKVVLGSATPSLESYYQAKNGKIKLYELSNRLAGGTLPQVHTVDLREELKNGNRSIFSEKLNSLIQDRLGKKQQIMLFLNRRGYAGFISCRSCGHVMKCPHCDVSLSEHKNGMLVCHYCGHEEPGVSKCPICGSKYITGFRAGTQQIEEQLRKDFPEAKVLRMDADTTKTKHSYEEILSTFSEQGADILVGTQMIVKGHDFPNVTLVGILAADLSLCANDFRAAERTFQLLTQAAGRAGRGNLLGEVVIQTYQPEHYSIIHAANQDYASFYQEELLYRELLSYPPAAHMLVLLIGSRNEESGIRLANQIKQQIIDRSVDEKLVMIGPAPASIGKINDIYRSVLYVKNKKYDTLVQVKDQMEEYINGLELKQETIQFDFDPMNTY